MAVGQHERAALVLPELPRREPYRTWPGSLIILAIIVVYVSIWVVADNEISPTLAPVAAGTRQQLGPGVTYVPRQGWYVDRTDSNASDSSANVVLAGSAGTLQFRVSPWTGTLADQVERQKKLDVVFGKVRLVGNDATFSTAGGLSGTTFSFISQRTQARVWVSVDETADRSIVVAGNATDTAFDQALPEFQAMLDSIRTEQS
jgi:hypothetical protein